MSMEKQHTGRIVRSISGFYDVQTCLLYTSVIVDTGEEILELVNPELVETSGEQCGAEGCLSVPGKYGLDVYKRQHPGGGASAGERRPLAQNLCPAPGRCV